MNARTRQKRALLRDRRRLDAWAVRFEAMFGPCRVFLAPGGRVVIELLGDVE